MTSNNTPENESSEVASTQSAKAVDDQLIEELVGRAQAEGLQLTGEEVCCSSSRNDFWSRRWRVKSPITSAMTGTIRRARTAATPATEPAPKRC